MSWGKDEERQSFTLQPSPSHKGDFNRRDLSKKDSFRVKSFIRKTLYAVNVNLPCALENSSVKLQKVMMGLGQFLVIDGLEAEFCVKNGSKSGHAAKGRH